MEGSSCLAGLCSPKHVALTMIIHIPRSVRLGLGDGALAHAEAFTTVQGAGLHLASASLAAARFPGACNCPSCVAGSGKGITALPGTRLPGNVTAWGCFSQHTSSGPSSVGLSLTCYLSLSRVVTDLVAWGRGSPRPLCTARHCRLRSASCRPSGKLPVLSEAGTCLAWQFGWK